MQGFWSWFLVTVLSFDELEVVDVDAPSGEAGELLL